jgi:hypothetical protein
VLEALVVAGQRTSPAAVHQVVKLRKGATNPVRWLFPRGDTAVPFSVRIVGAQITRTMRGVWAPTNPSVELLNNDGVRGTHVGLSFIVKRQETGRDGVG